MVDLMNNSIYFDANWRLNEYVGFGMIVAIKLRAQCKWDSNIITFAWSESERQVEKLN